MDCSQFQRRLSEWLCGDLPGGLSEEMQAHLEECDRCRGVYAAEIELQEALRALSDSKLRRTFRLRIYWNILVFELLNLLRLLNPARFRRVSWLRYAVVLGLVVAVWLAVTEWPGKSSRGHRPAYSAREVQQGLNYARFALSFVLYATKKSENLVSKQVLPRQVILPLRQGIQTTIKSLKIGGKS